MTTTIAQAIEATQSIQASRRIGVSLVDRIATIYADGSVCVAADGRLVAAAEIASDDQSVVCYRSTDAAAAGVITVCRAHVADRQSTARYMLAGHDATEAVLRRACTLDPDTEARR